VKLAQTDYNDAIISKKDSADRVVDYFDTYFDAPVSYAQNELDAVVGFFQNAGFGQESATSIAGVLLFQAKIENVPVMKLIDTLKQYTPPQLSQVVSQIVNNYRSSTSAIGYKSDRQPSDYASRNIKA